MRIAKQLEAFQLELIRWLQIENDNLLCDALRAAIVTAEVLGYLAEAIAEQERALGRRFEAAAKSAGGTQNSAAAGTILGAARVIAGGTEQPEYPDLLAAWHTAGLSDSELRQLWFATEAFTLACYRRAVAQLLRLLSFGILLPAVPAGEWDRLEQDAAALVSFAGAAALVAQRARRELELEHLGPQLCSNLERLAGVAAALHVLVEEWKPSPTNAAAAGDMSAQLERLFDRSQLWLDEAIRLLEAPAGYRPPG